MADHPEPTPPAWLTRLQARLDERRSDGLLRALPDPVDDPDLIDLRHNDYLALRHHPDLVHALHATAASDGAGSGGSRLVADHPPVRDFEARFAAFKHTDAALLLPSGYLANLAALTALSAPGDLILLDRLAHASLIDAARLATAHAPRVAWRTFPHNDVRRAEVVARRHLEDHPAATILLVTETVFSMDGDLADLHALARLRDHLAAEHHAAALLVDDAHATGVLPPDHARGLADLHVATGGKALGLLGGMIAGPRPAIDAVINFARPFIYATGVMPAHAAALSVALDLIADPARTTRLTDIITRVRAGLRAAGWPVAAAADHATPIIPLIVGTPEDALRLAAHFRARGILAPAIRPPTVPRDTARLRLSLHAALSDEACDRIIEAAATFPSTRRISPAPADVLS